MDDTLLFIPPCCASDKMPKAMMAAPRNALIFYTHGDVSFELFYKAISYLVDEPHVLVLTMPLIDPSTVAYLSLCFDRGWITDLVLSTSSNESKLIDKYLSPYKPHILLVDSRNVTQYSAHMVLYGRNKALTLNGPMLYTKSTENLVSYSAQLHISTALWSDNIKWGNPLLNILLPDVLRIRKKYNKHVEGKSEALKRFVEQRFMPQDDDED